MSRDLSMPERMAVNPLARKIFKYDQETYGLWDDMRFDDLPWLLRLLYFEQAIIWQKRGLLDLRGL